MTYHLVGLKTLIGVLSAFCTMGAIHMAHAQATFDVSILAGSCANCHGTDGRSPGGIPSLAGRPADLLKAQMLAFRSDAPQPGITIMNRLAKGYSDAEIEALAQYFSMITPAAPVSPSTSSPASMPTSVPAQNKELR